MQMIQNAGQWHKLWSVRLALAGAVFNASVVGWVVFQSSVSPILWGSVNMALGIGVAVVRVLQQAPKDGDPQ